jgi:hypothetical protein
MKALKLSLLFVVVIAVLCGCEKIGKKDFTAYLIQDFEVTVNETTGEFEVNICDIFSSLDDAEVAQVKETIEAYGIEEISYRIWEYIGPVEADFTGSMDIGRPSDGLIQVTKTISGSSIKSLEEAGKQVLDLSMAQQETIRGTLLNEHGIKVFFHGDVSEAPMSFIVQVIVRVTATAEVQE